MRSVIMMVAAAALMAAVAGCDKGDGAGKGAAPSGVDGVLEAWKKAGLTVSAFDAADGAKYGGGECKSGTVSGVDAVLCVFATPDLAKAAEAKGLAAVGDTTGSSLAEGKLLLVVADRRKADPQGKTINQATKLFRGR